MRKATVWRLVITVLLAFLAAVAIFAIWIIPGSINGRIRALVPVGATRRGLRRLASTRRRERRDVEGEPGERRKRAHVTPGRE